MTLTPLAAPGCALPVIDKCPGSSLIHPTIELLQAAVFPKFKGPDEGCRSHLASHLGMSKTEAQRMLRLRPRLG